MDLGLFGNITYNWAIFSALFSIVIIDLILAGDNAVVIAMAVRSLPKAQRGRGILWGAAAAVLLRVLATFFVSQMLQLQFIKHKFSRCYIQIPNDLDSQLQRLPVQVQKTVGMGVSSTRSMAFSATQLQ